MFILGCCSSLANTGTAWERIIVYQSSSRSTGLVTGLNTQKHQIQRNYCLQVARSPEQPELHLFENHCPSQYCQESWWRSVWHVATPLSNMWGQTWERESWHWFLQSRGVWRGWGWRRRRRRTGSSRWVHQSDMIGPNRHQPRPVKDCIYILELYFTPSLKMSTKFTWAWPRGASGEE